MTGVATVEHLPISRLKLHVVSGRDRLMDLFERSLFNRLENFRQPDLVPRRVLL